MKPSRKLEMSRRNFLRKVCFGLLVSSIVFYGCNSFLSNTEFVKKSVFEDDYSISIGDALDNYEYFTHTEWSEFTTPQGREVVEFKGNYFKNDVIVRIQFVINKDREEDDDGLSFRIGYQSYIYVTAKGEKREIEGSYLIDKIYENKEMQWLSNENLRKY